MVIRAGAVPVWFRDLLSRPEAGPGRPGSVPPDRPPARPGLPGPAGSSALHAAIGRFAVRHRVFVAAVCAAAALRVIAELGYRWAIWFNDSFDYVAIALHPHPDPVRSGGYPLLLWVLKPFHSLALVTFGQHLLALAGAALLYALLRRLGLPGWGATLAVVPLLFDAYQIQLEQLLLGDTLAEFLLIAAAVVVLWWFPVGRWRGTARTVPAGLAVLVSAGAGLLFGAAAVTRAVALPLAVAGLAYLLIARAGWRAITASAAAAAAPLAGYALWFHAAHGVYALDSADGVFLWARTAAFAECTKIKPPAAEAWLCPRLPPARRAASSSQVWQPDSPLDWGRGQVFSAAENAAARRFALRAIAAQPGDYARTVLASTGRTFTWSRAAYPTPYTANSYKFSGTKTRLPQWPVTVEGNAGKAVPGTTEGVARAYAGGDPATVIVRPYSTLMRWYQRYVYLRGTLLGVILLVTPVALAAAGWRERRRSRRSGSRAEQGRYTGVGASAEVSRGDGSESADSSGESGPSDRWGHSLAGAALFCWAAAVTLIVIPAMTVDFDYRYVLPAVPFGCAAAVLAVRRLCAGPTHRSPDGAAAASIRTVREFTATDD
jgi:hypothetical protein